MSFTALSRLTHCRAAVSTTLPKNKSVLSKVVLPTLLLPLSPPPPLPQHRYHHHRCYRRRQQQQPNLSDHTRFGDSCLRSLSTSAVRLGMAASSSSPAPSAQPVVVLGAGVLGLSSALTIQSRHPDNPIAIVAAELPSLPSTWNDVNVDGGAESTSRPSADYASMWAGAHYRPIPRSSRQLEEESELAFRTHEIMLGFAGKHDARECGVGVMPAVELLERPGAVDLALKTGDAYASNNDNFRVLSVEELQGYQVLADGETDSTEQGRVQWGCAYDTYCVNVHVYCRWLLDRFTSRGGQALKRKVSKLEDTFHSNALASELGFARELPLVVNCSGRNFDTDPATKIIRGQTVLVKNMYHQTVTRQNSDGSWAFLIPRPGDGGTVVGGTKEIGDLETGARPETRKELLDNAVKYFPDFVGHVDEFEVLTDNVGRRPWREGGLRIEVEEMPAVKGKVVHGYGAGGRGYEISWGVAGKVAELVDRVLGGTAA